MGASESRSWRLPTGTSGRGSRVFAERSGARRGRRGVGSLVVVAAVLAVFAVPGLGRPVALASSSPVLNWTYQGPATSPSDRAGASMAYDAATGTVVLFGGDDRYPLGGTWTWDGSTWTEQHPATSPSARELASMAYDAATHTVVMFGGRGRYGPALAGTWTWDGSTWTKQAPATSPPAQAGVAMAYDAATRTVLLFGVGPHSQTFGVTWTWDGSTWTKQHPATSPPARGGASMAYDAATRTVVLFGGFGRARYGPTFGGTWTWDGSTWTKQHPATSPPARWDAPMAYDAATGTVVLFGGFDSIGDPSGGTWTWDGSTWTKQHPATSPPAKAAAPMAYDAATGTVVMFGGVSSDDLGTINDTWTWGSK